MFSLIMKRKAENLVLWFCSSFVVVLDAHASSLPKSSPACQPKVQESCPKTKILPKENAKEKPSLVSMSLRVPSSPLCFVKRGFVFLCRETMAVLRLVPCFLRDIHKPMTTNDTGIFHFNGSRRPQKKHILCLLLRSYAGMRHRGV